MSKTVILSCPTLKRELMSIMEAHHSDAVVHFMPRTLHSDPAKLHKYVQNAIDNLWNVDRIVVCASRCGGGTANLKATTAPLVLPRTRDCLDILLSGTGLDSLHRDIGGIYYTESWMEFSKNSSINLDTLIEKKGKKEAEDFIRRLYRTLNKFYIIDTGCYDIKEVEDYIAPLVKILDGTVTVLKGGCGILHKMATEKFDDDFVIIPKGETVPGEAFLENK